MPAVPTARLERHQRLLDVARVAASLGARLGTVLALTGLEKGLVNELLYRGYRVPGDMPSDPYWLLKANSIVNAQASVLCVVIDELVRLGIAPEEALLCAYRLYADANRVENAAASPDRPGKRVGDPGLSISFDRAFDIVRHTFGFWSGTAGVLRLVRCHVCSARFLGWIASGSAKQGNGSAADRPARVGCPFCRLRGGLQRDRHLKRHVEQLSRVREQRLCHAKAAPERELSR